MARSRSLRFHLSLRYGVMIVLGCGLALVWLYATLRLSMTHREDEELREDGQALVEVYRSEGLEALIEVLQLETQAEEEFALIIDQSGSPFIHFSSELDDWPSLALPSYIVASLGRSDDSIDYLFPPHPDFATRVLTRQLDEHRILQIGEGLRSRSEILDQVFRFSILLLLLVAPLALALGWLASRSMFDGVLAAARAAERFRAGELNARVNLLSQPQEVQSLGDAFDAMADRIEELMEGMRSVMDSVAHDLRSPIARIRVLCERPTNAGIDGERIIRECHKLIEMVDASLELSSIESGIELGGERVSFSEIVEDAVDLFLPVAELKGIQLSAIVDSELYLQGDLPRLQRMVSNLIDNAIRYIASGSRVRVTACSSAMVIELVVEDDGPGIAPDLRGHVFDRFYKIEPSRGSDSHGLGLSIVRAIALAHNGDVLLAEAAGGGCRFVVRLPMPEGVADERANLTI